MPELQRHVMHAIHGEDIWQDFSPLPNLDLQGWHGEHCSFLRVPQFPDPKIVIDVGVWKGLSTITLARIMRNHAIDGVVIAVDTFLGSPEHHRDRRLFSRCHGLPTLYQTFMSNVAHLGLTDYVVPLAQTSANAAKIIADAGLSACAVHIDAAHEYRGALNDLEDFWPLIADGGTLIGDDYDPSWPGVVEAAQQFASRVARPIEIIEPKFLLSKCA